MTITTPQIATSTKSDVGVSAGDGDEPGPDLDASQGGEVQQGPVKVDGGPQTVQTDGFMTVNMAGELSGTSRLAPGDVVGEGRLPSTAGLVTVMGGW
ncbi:MAG: hypothetical protein R3F60_04660 [bacterium]